MLRLSRGHSRPASSCAITSKKQKKIKRHRYRTPPAENEGECSSTTDSTRHTEPNIEAERRREGRRERERVDRRGTGKRHGVEKRIAGG